MKDWEAMLETHITALLAPLCAEGFAPPLHCAFMDANGSMLYGQYEPRDGGEPAFTMVTVRLAAADFTLPVHVMCVDQSGGAVHAALEGKAEPDTVWN